SFSLSNGAIDTLRNRMNYVNVHSSAFNSGELRGQLLPLATSYFTTNLRGQNELPAITTDAIGAMKFELTNNVLTATGRFDDLEGAFASEIAGGAHVHLAPVGANGGIAFNLTTTLDEDEIGGSYLAADNQIELTEEQSEALYANGLYVNIHSAAHNSGELRGQILPELNRFPIGGAIVFPEDNAEVTVEGAATDVISPAWSAGEDRNVLAYTWELAADEAFVIGLFNQGVGQDTTIDLPLGVIDSLLAGAQLPIGLGITLYHRVTTSDGAVSVVSPASAVVLTRGTVTSTNNLTPGVSSMAVFPTVVDDQVNLQLETDAPVDAQIYIFDPMGRPLQQRLVEYAAYTKSTEQFNVANLPAGNYYLSVQSNGQIATRMFIVR
ncbi:MAG: CHRD domain-containing protein, partial [Bacteroidota bacterium]